MIKLELPAGYASSSGTNALTNSIDSKFPDYALIDYRRVYVSIGNNNFPTFQSRLDPCMRVVKSICCKETSLLERGFVSDFDGFQSEPTKVAMSSWLMGLMNFTEWVLR